MKIIELFSGTKSISNAFSSRGHETFTIDNDPDLKPDLCMDMLSFNISMLPKEWRTPDIIWASPPCQTFSVCTIYRNFKDGKPCNSKSYIGLALAMKCIEIIEQLKPKFWFIENPRGMLRKQHFMPNGLRKTLTYCQYGENYQKPTDIWTNAQHWIPKKACKAGDTCHEYQPRTYKQKVNRGVLKLGIQGLANAKERGKIPQKLCDEIVDACEGKLKNIQQSL